MSRAELARKLGTSTAAITATLRGDAKVRWLECHESTPVPEAQLKSAVAWAKQAGGGRHARPPPLQLEELFFPAPEVRACPAHDPQGETRGTTVKQSFDLLVLDASINSYGLLLDISSDDDKSVNPPYQFRLQAYARFVVAQTVDPVTAQAMVQANGALVLGALRERLPELTSRAPWGRFLLGTQGVPVLQPQNSSGI